MRWLLLLLSRRRRLDVLRSMLGRMLRGMLRMLSGVLRGGELRSVTRSMLWGVLRGMLRRVLGRMSRRMCAGGWAFPPGCRCGSRRRGLLLGRWSLRLLSMSHRRLHRRGGMVLRMLSMLLLRLRGLRWLGGVRSIVDRLVAPIYVGLLGSIGRLTVPTGMVSKRVRRWSWRRLALLLRLQRLLMLERWHRCRRQRTP